MCVYYVPNDSYVFQSYLLYFETLPNVLAICLLALPYIAGNINCSMRLQFIVVSLFLLTNSQAQTKPKDLQTFLSEAGVKPTKVMLVGTFHFAYQNLDMHKTDKKNMRDILSQKSQAELQQLLDVFRAYKPTRIYLESKDQQWLDSSYNACTDSTLKTKPNERIQIGFRLAKELKMVKVYSVDADELINDWNNTDSVSLLKVFGSDSLADKAHTRLLGKTYEAYYSYQDSLCATAPLLDAFIFMNKTRNLQLNEGVYLSGYFNTLSNYGPDFLATWFMDRNLRIFNNVLLSKPSPDDRILMLFGAGHVPFLKHSFESSPDFEYVDFYKETIKMIGKQKRY